MARAAPRLAREGAGLNIRTRSWNSVCIGQDQPLTRSPTKPPFAPVPVGPQPLDLGHLSHVDASTGIQADCPQTHLSGILTTAN